jgi:hypothetical protein
LSAAVELRRLFPGVMDNAKARECARTIAAWKPLPERLRRVRTPGKALSGRLDGESGPIRPHARIPGNLLPDAGVTGGGTSWRGPDRRCPKI